MNVNAGNIRSRFVKGLANPHVRAKVENLAYVFPATFDALSAAASHHELSLRREKKAGASNGGGNAAEEKKKSGVAGITVPTAPGTPVSTLPTDVQRMIDESLSKHVRELKRELATQRQINARTQME